MGLIFSLLLSIYGLTLNVKQYGRTVKLSFTVGVKNSERNIFLGLLCLFVIFWLGSHFLIIGLIIMSPLSKLTFLKAYDNLNLKWSKNAINWSRALLKFWPVIFVFSVLSIFLLGDYPVQRSVHQLRDGSVSQIISIIISSLLIAPIIEEVVFRKFLYSGIKSKLGIGMSSILSSFAFALIHFNIFSFAILFLFGIFLCFCYEIFNSLYASIWIHFVFNLVMVVSIIVK